MEQTPYEVPVLEREAAGRNWFGTGVAIVVVLAVIACAYEGFVWYRARQAEESAPPPPPPAVTAPAPPAEAGSEAPSHPIEQSESAVPLTPENGDAMLMAELARLTGTGGLEHLVRPAGLMRRIVATVDALPRQHVPQQIVPNMPVPGAFLVESRAGAQYIAAGNAKRYLPWVHLLVSVDPTAAAATYKRFYPLFQQSYRALGYPKGYFNDRLIEAIDDMLEAPAPEHEPKLTLPSVMWHYADPDLEELSAGQKMMLRLGRTSAGAVREWLSAFRAKIA